LVWLVLIRLILGLLGLRRLVLRILLALIRRFRVRRSLVLVVLLRICLVLAGLVLIGLVLLAGRHGLGALILASLIRLRTLRGGAWDGALIRAGHGGARPAAGHHRAIARSDDRAAGDDRGRTVGPDDLAGRVRVRLIRRDGRLRLRLQDLRQQLV